MEFLINHLGFQSTAVNKAVFQCSKDLGDLQFQLVKSERQSVCNAVLLNKGNVEGWKKRYFYEIEIPSVKDTGLFYLETEVQGEICKSEVFEMKENNPLHELFPDFLSYFRFMRCAGKFDEQDHKIPVFGNEEKIVDVHGGWYDASGDTSKYFSHLSYANYMNPQQIPMAVWLLLDSIGNLSSAHSEVLNGVKDEAVFGCDFLVRMCDEEGYFYMTVFDKWSKKLEERKICAFSTMKGNRSDDYQCAFRQGAGAAIASLALAGRSGLSGEYTSGQYLETADKAYKHLLKHNLEYCNNNKENIIDEYCALLAASELYAAFKSDFYFQEAEKWAKRLLLRQVSDSNYADYWENDTDIPYFHAAEAGLPIIALLRFLENLPSSELKTDAESAVIKSVNHELSISTEVNNPFFYSRQYILNSKQKKHGAFFIPHKNWSGYWWQGENARIASVASALMKAKKQLPALEADIQKMYQAQLDWIFGSNPFDLCMVHGLGRNNAEYLSNYRNAKGGVINGITSGFMDEDDITFMPPDSGGMQNNWRWSEQWLIHASWLYYALSLGV